MTTLLEASFKRKVDEERYYQRLKERLEFVIVAGDYLGAVVVTSEPFEEEGEEEKEGGREPGERHCITNLTTTDTINTTPVSSPSHLTSTFSYLDKFAVSPLAQNSGTSDFLWSALRDETFGSSLPSALNSVPGSVVGGGRDLVWRSRADNGVNKWYFERSSGFWTTGLGGKWKLFWCDREVENHPGVREHQKKKGEKTPGGGGGGGGRVEGGGEKGGKDEERIGGEVERLERWSKAVETIPSAWSD